MNVKLKKVLCCALATLLLSFYTLSCCVYASGVYPTPTPVGGMPWWDDKDWEELNKIEASAPPSMKFMEILATMITGSEVANKELGQGVANVLGTLLHDLANNGNIRKDDNNYYINAEGINQINQAVQDKVYALDGYYLYDSCKNYDFDSIVGSYKSRVDGYSDSNRSFVTNMIDKNDFCFSWSRESNFFFFSLKNRYFFLNGSESLGFIDYSNDDYSTGSVYCQGFSLGSSSPSTTSHTLPGNFYKVVQWNIFCNSPIKIFYSLQDVKNFLAKGRTYAPQLPNTTISIPIKYINNSVSLPDITYNINTTNKTEVEIQNEYNTTLNNYLNDLNKFSDGGSGNNPTPTPSGGGSGNFGDGSTPTPTPPLGDGGSDQDGDGSGSWLKKIYDQLVKLSDSVSQHFEKEETFEDKLSKYLESHDKKLDGIVDAIDKLSQGKEEGEEKGCKYNYTELSDFMTKLWNDSDQKFDQMVELLKENNEYQEKMLSTLNSIKNILLAQTVMDAFKNRSSETANKAKEKFPTSVPWDIALIVNAMDAEPKAPVFELPIKIERLNIDEKITVDISSGEWEKLAKACRYMLSLLFVLFMVNLTRKLFFSKGDD